MSNDWRISIAALLVLIAACNRQVDEKKMREMVREEVQREVARQVEEYQKAWKKSPVAKIGKIAEEEKPVTAQPESALPRAPIYDGATRQK
ncbi:hypothetical protein KJ865_04215, partial [Myxococcota bacterium]|nr:hypothetical protein [Myxococcota bacterium]